MSWQCLEEWLSKQEQGQRRSKCKDPGAEACPAVCGKTKSKAESSSEARGVAGKRSGGLEDHRRDFVERGATAGF